jgi:hypothetical protein
MKPTWLVHNYDQEEYEKLVEALVKTETPFQTIEYKNSLDTLDKSIMPKSDECVVVSGSIQFANRLKNQGLVYSPGLYGFSNKTDCSHYVPKIPIEYLLNFPYALTTWAELKRSKDYYKQLFFNTELFVRPNSGNKLFPGQGIYYSNWDETIEEIEKTSGITEESLILIAKHKAIKDKEYRFVIVDKKVVTGSMYNWSKESSPEYPKEAEELAQKIADLDWQLDSAYTCDIAMGNNIGPRLIELNSFSCAGLYSCDRVKIVEAINKVALRDYNEVYEIVS